MELHDTKTSLADSTEENQTHSSLNGQAPPSLSSSSEVASTDGSSSSQESNSNAFKDKGKKKKPRSEASVFHDKQRGVCSCKHCGWIYPNPRPSAKLRREHRKHCSRFKSVHAWLEEEEDPASEQAQVEGEEMISRESDEHSTDDNDQPESVSIDEEISTGKEQEVEVNSPPPKDLEGESSSTLEQTLGEVVEEDSSTLEHPSTSEKMLGEVVEERKQDQVPGSSNLKQTLPSPSTSDQTLKGAEGSKQDENESPSEFDLERILKEQTSHHLLCPNCGSCITRRVILKKRKRTVSRVSEPQEKKVPKLEEPIQEERDVVESERGVESPPGDETEAWGCLACFSIFFHKVREQLQEPLERAQNVSCLPYLLPEFHWDGEGYTVVEELPERVSERSACFPIEFPWTKQTERETEPPHAEDHETREVEIVIDLTKPNKAIILPDVDWKVHEQRDTGPVPAKQSESDSSCLPLKFPSFQTKEVARGEEVQEIQEIEESRDRLDCLPVLLPKYWGLDRESSEVQGETERTTAGFKCLPALLPSYSWSSSTATGPQEKEEPATPSLPPKVEEPHEKEKEEAVIPSPPPKVEEPQEKEPSTPPPLISKVEGPQKEEPKAPPPLPPKVEETPQQEEQESTPQAPAEDEDRTSICVPLTLPDTASFNCLQTVLPSFSWDGDGTSAAREKTPATEDDSICFPINFPRGSWRWNEESEEERRYVTRETRVQAWIKTITNVVTVKSSGEKQEELPSQETSFLDVTVSEQTQGAEKHTKTEALVTTPSTGWALLDALDKEDTLKLEEAEEEDTKLVDKRRKKPEKQQTEIEEVQAPVISDKALGSIQDILSELHKRKPGDELKQPLVTTSQEELDVEELLSKIPGDYEPPPPSYGPVSTTVSVKSSDSLIEVRGDDPKRAVETALAIAEVVPGTQEILQESRGQTSEYVKSIVYGGLDVTLTSLAVVSSGAGSGTKTINVIAISLANLVAGLITLLHSIGSMYQSDRASFEEYVGKSLWVNGTISVISFLVFGCIAPLTYGLSFRSANDQDYKFAATAMASLACIGLMGLCKAYVRKKSYGATIVNLIITGFVASVAGYFVGDYVKRWLKKIGYDDEAPVSPSPPAPGVVLLKKHGLELGRRGGERLL